PNAAWAEKYIESCVSQGIVSGVGGGRFSPNGNVTGSQLAKMLLVCLGFDSDIEGYTGNAWDMNVNVRATQKGLYKGLEGLDVSAALTRDTAAQMVWNALQAGEVKYEYTWVGGDATKVTAVDKLDNANNPITLLKDKYNATIVDEGVLTTVEQDSKGTYNVKTDAKEGTYTKVEKDYSDLMGQKVDVMVKDDDHSKVYGIYANEDSKVIATGVVGDLDPVTGDNEKIKLDSTEYKIDSGAKVYHFNKTADDGTLISLAKAPSGVQDAYSIKLIDNDGNGKIDRAVVTPFAVAEVTYVGTSSMTFQAVNGFATIGNKDVDDVTAYDGIAEDDWVIVYADSDTVDGNYNVEKATVVTGEVTGTRNKDTEGLIDGTWYTSLVSGETFNVGDTVDVVTVGKYAFDVEISDTSTTSADVLYVDNAEVKETGLDAGLTAKLYFTDGTTKTAKISKIDGKKVIVTGIAGADEILVSSAASYIDKVYTFSVDGDKYEIKTISDSNKAGFKGQDTVKSYADKTLTLSNKGTAKIADDAVIFVEGDDDTKVVSGATVNAWGKGQITFTADNSIVLYSESNGFKYVQVGSLKLASGNIPDASGDTAYGYVTADPYLIKEEGTHYIQYTLWTADGEKVVREKVSSTTIEKGDFVSYNVGDGTTVKDVAEALTAGAVTAYAGGEDINMVQADNSDISSFANKMADDATVVYVNTEDTKGVDGGKIRTASKDSNGKYIANVMYKLDSENKVEVLFVDVNNDLEAVDNPVIADDKKAVADAVSALKSAVTTGSADGTAEKPYTKTVTNADGKSLDLITFSASGTTVSASIVGDTATKITSVKYADGKLTATSTENMVDGIVKLAITIANNNATATVYVDVTLN
ncbi:MAG: S-layer homology domain-containing protein, partial [Evtepia gabavorous]|uniref:S-layer homology domain-containing protein n=1 Tax=Evtepia gabavorous TaxID=2211183 RepID=UPI002E7A748B